MTERERLEIDLDSIKLVYQTQHKEFKEKLSKEKYPYQKRRGWILPCKNMRFRYIQGV